MKPTKEEVQAVIDQLTEIEPKVRAVSFFGDDNRAAIRAQIRVLKNKMDEDEIYELWDRGEEDQYERSSALQAMQWMNGEPIEDSEEDNLVDGWKGLIRE